MRGESKRDCRARGGSIPVHPDGKGSKPLKAFNSNAPTTGTPDASLKRGSGPLFRKHGGHIPNFDDDRDDKATGGAISGAGAKPSMGRAGRKSGGGVGADLKPLTHAGNPRKPPGRKYMGDGERTP
jgi:hypothetical protein